MNRRELEKRLIKMLKKKDETEPAEMVATFAAYLRQMSSDISGVIVPINSFNVNFLVAMLESYAESLRQSMPCDEDAIRQIKGFNTGKIVIALPTDVLEDEDEDEEDNT